MTQNYLRQHLRKLPLKYLRELVTDAQSLIRDLEAAPVRREIDIAAEHDDNVDLIHSVVRTIGDRATGRWRQVEKIYCSLEHCPRCPHGEFIFRYRRNKRKKHVTVTFVGTPGLPNEVLEQMRLDIRPPVAAVDILAVTKGE
jgi:hypothetical protein